MSNGTYSGNYPPFGGVSLNDINVWTALNTFTGGLRSTTTPTNSNDVINLNYFQAYLNGIYLSSVATFSETNITLSGFQTINGVDLSVSANKGVLLTGQTAPLENGIWTASAGAWTRRADCAIGTDQAGTYVPILSGIGANNIWQQNANPAIVGTNALVYTLFSYGGIIQTDDEGLLITGNILSLDLDGTTLVKSLDGLKVSDNLVVTGLKSTTSFQLEAGAATNYIMTSSNNSGNAQWSQFLSLTSQVNGILQAAQFPALSGDVTTSAGSLTTAILASVVTGKLLTGYSVGANTAIAATDSILVAFGKAQGQINSTVNSAITSLTGDGTASGPGAAVLTLANVNSNNGSFGSSTAIPSFTVNAKGLITAASTNAVIAPAGTLSGSTLASGVTASSLTSLGILTSLAVGSASQFSVSSTGALTCSSSSGGSTTIFKSTNTGANDETLQFITSYPSSANTNIAKIVAAPSNTGGRLQFFTAQNSTGTATERLRIDDFGGFYNYTETFRILNTTGGSFTDLGSTNGGSNNETLRFLTSYVSTANPNKVLGQILGSPQSTGGSLSFQTSNLAGSITEYLNIAPDGYVSVNNSDLLVQNGYIGIGKLPGYEIDILKSGTNVTGAISITSGTGTGTGNISSLFLKNLGGGGGLVEGSVSSKYQSLLGEYCLELNPGPTTGSVYSTANLGVITAGKGLQVKSGANCKMGYGTLSSGSCTVNNSTITANSYIFLTSVGPSTFGALSQPSRVVGTSFTVKSDLVSDSSDFIYFIVEAI